MRTRVLFILAVMAMTAMNVNAQTLESESDNITGYVKMDRASGQVLTIQNGAVYAGHWLIKVESTTEPQTFEIPSWVTRICPGAFSEANISTLRFPSSWTESILRQPSIFISPHAFDNSKIQNFETYNDGSTSSVSSAKRNTGNEVIATYDVSGRRIGTDAEGINIVRYTDGSVSKVQK